MIEKQCVCKGASASGPRIVRVAETGLRGVPGVPVLLRSIRLPFAFVAMACDACDAPWRAAPSGEPERGAP